MKMNDMIFSKICLYLCFYTIIFQFIYFFLITNMFNAYKYSDYVFFFSFILQFYAHFFRSNY